MIQLNKHPGQRILELGGGDNPHPETDVRVDIRFGPYTHFTADFEKPLPIQDNDFDAVYAHFVLEHISYRNVPAFLAECLRVLKPGGMAIFALPNTEAQILWLQRHPDGWDGKDDFHSASCMLFGDNDYPENTHRAYFSPQIAERLFGVAGFTQIRVRPYGERDTDMVVTANKYDPAEGVHGHLTGISVEKYPNLPIPEEFKKPIVLVSLEDHMQMVADAAVAQTMQERQILSGAPDAPKPQGVIHVKEFSSEDRAGLFDKHYFNGGGKVGGYAREGYWDYPCHEITAAHVLARKPTSVLELGCARGYVLKRLQCAAVRGVGLEVSRHCHMTRVCDPIHLHDLCRAPWSMVKWDQVSPMLDLCYSVATLEHIPEQYLPAVLAEMTRTCLRGLHGIDFGGKDDGFDKTHCTLRPKSWWQEVFARYAPGWPVEIVDKEALESPVGLEDWPTRWQQILQGDGKIKLNVGSFTTMFHRGWTNLDLHDLHQYAQHYGYKYQQCDTREGLPFPTGKVDLIFAHHFLEHLTYDEGLRFLRECRRVLKPDGALRLVVPNVNFLIGLYHNQNCDPTDPDLAMYVDGLGQFNEINDEVTKRSTDAGKLYELLVGGDHKAFYDSGTLCEQLRVSGFISCVSSFGSTFTSIEPLVREGILQILRETLEMPFGGISLFVDAVPLVA